MLVKKCIVLESLKKLIPAVGFGSGNPNNTFSFFKKNNNSFISTMNDDIAILCKSPIDVAENVSVRANELFSVLKSLPDEDIDIFMNKKDSFVVETKDSYTSIVTYPHINYFAEAVNISGNWKKLPESFFNKVEVCSKACARDNFISEILKYVYIDGCDVMGADGNQLISAKLEEPVEKMFIKHSCVKDLAALNLTYYNYSDGWILFCKDSDLLFAVRTISNKERYPFIINKEEWNEEELLKRKNLILDNLLNVSGVPIEIGNKADILKAINSCLVFTKDEKQNLLQITIKKDKLIIEGSGTFGKHSRSFNTESSVEFSFKIHPFVFAGAVRNTETKFIVNESALLVDSSDFKQLLSLQRG